MNNAGVILHYVSIGASIEGDTRHAADYADIAILKMNESLETEVIISWTRLEGRTSTHQLQRLDIS